MFTNPSFLILSLSKDADAPRTNRRRERVWIPAFAGNAEDRNKAPYGEAGVGGQAFVQPLSIAQTAKA